MALVAALALAGYLWYRNNKLLGAILSAEQLLRAQTSSVAMILLLGRDAVNELSLGNDSKSESADKIKQLVHQTEKTMGKGYLEMMAMQAVSLGKQLKEKTKNMFEDDSADGPPSTRH